MLGFGGILALFGRLSGVPQGGGFWLRVRLAIRSPRESGLAQIDIHVTDVIAIDEVGCVPLAELGAEFLFQIIAELLSDITHDTRRDLGHVSQRAAGESKESEVHREAQSVGWSTMTIDDVRVAVSQRVETPEVALGQIRRDACERVALFSGEQAWCLGYHSTGSVWE